MAAGRWVSVPACLMRVYLLSEASHRKFKDICRPGQGKHGVRQREEREQEDFIIYFLMRDSQHVTPLHQLICFVA